MNNAISTIVLDLSQRLRFRRGALRSAARDSVRGQPPASGQPYAAEETVLAAYSRRLRAPGYWATPTLVAIFLATLVAAGAAAGWFFAELPITRWASIAGGLAALACICYALFANMGPEFIAEDRYELARRDLADSGDSTVHSGGTVAIGWFFLLACVEGAISAVSLLPYFEETLTPFLARLAPWLVALMVGGSLFKLTKEAAREARIRKVRRTYRALAVTDPQTASRMRALISSELGGDFSSTQRPFAATAFLLAFVLAAGAAVFFGRTIASSVNAAVPATAETGSPRVAHVVRIATVETEPSSGRQEPLLGALVAPAAMLIFFLAAVAGGYIARVTTTPVRHKSLTDLRIIKRFDSLDELQQFHRQHAEGIALRCRDTLLRFGRELQKERSKIDPARAWLYPDARMHELAWDLLQRSMWQGAARSVDARPADSTTQHSVNW